jgi:hypothetical protein
VGDAGATLFVSFAINWGGSMFLRRLGLAILLVIVTEATALGGGFRCPKNQRIVEEGSTTTQVIAICGQPKSREDLTSGDCDEFGRCSHPHKVGELWIYDFGPYTLTIILTFYGNRLMKVDQGNYGS